MFTLAIKPLQNGYVPTIGNGVLEQDLSNGFARQRTQFVGSVHVVSASLLLESKVKQQYWWAFWRMHTLKPQRFLWRLICDDYEMRLYECQFIPSTLQVGERNANIHNVSFQVRCKPLNNQNIELDEGVIASWETGDADWINELEKLVNEHLPNALGV